MAIAKDKVRESLTWEKALSEKYHQQAKREGYTLSEFIVGRLRESERAREEREDLLKDKVTHLATEMRAMRQEMRQVVDLLEALVKQLTPSAPAFEEPLPIATYEQMYGPLNAAQESAASSATPDPGPKPVTARRRWGFKSW